MAAIHNSPIPLDLADFQLLWVDNLFAAVETILIPAYPDLNTGSLSSSSRPIETGKEVAVFWSLFFPRSQQHRSWPIGKNCLGPGIVLLQ